MILSLSLFVVVLVVVVIWLAAVTLVMYRWHTTYKLITKDAHPKDFVGALVSLSNHDQAVDSQIEKISKTLAKLEADVVPHIQKIGFVRYNPFGNTGGDQSFCICLLDERNNGVLLTSLHTRQQTRLYTKEIINNQPKDETPLSKEEQACLKSAQKWSQV